MKKPRFTVALALLASLLLAVPAALAQGQGQNEPKLKVGDPAPPLSDGEWVKGEPVSEFEDGKVYVVEFWATWCGPCIAAIPHVTELQQKYEDKGLVVIGQNVFENNTSAVEPFVEKMGDKMDYRVVMDSPSGQEGHMAKNWMQAAGRNGIPCSFIVDKEGKIAWIGHPMQMDKPLEQIIAGNYDPEAEAKKEKQFQETAAKLGPAVESGDMDQAMKVIDELEQIRPEMAGQLATVRFRVLGQAGEWDRAYEELEKGIDKIEEAQPLNEIAWMIVDPASQVPEKNYDVAMKAAEKANKLSEEKDPAILDTLARAHWVKDNKEKAIELQKKAIELAEDQALKQQLQQTLDEYQK